ncbi:hypothetical protein [Aquitalea pelogenes]|uniref:hypothetical protein n=1 Tax=Aquitalea pelogenes TaxID=1293573 RepID=UPI0035AF448E
MNNWKEIYAKRKADNEYANKSFNDWSLVDSKFLSVENQMMRHLRLGTAKIKFYDKESKQVVDKILITKPFIPQVILCAKGRLFNANKDIRNNELSKLFESKLRGSTRGRSNKSEIKIIRDFIGSTGTNEDVEEFDYLVSQHDDKKNITNTDFYTKYEKVFKEKFGREPRINHRVIDYFSKFGLMEWSQELLVDKLFDEVIDWNHRCYSLYNNQKISLSLNLPKKERFEEDGEFLEDAYDEVLHEELQNYNLRLDMYKYAIYPRIAIDYSILAWLDLNSLETSYWIDLIKLNSFIPLSIIPSSTKEKFSDDEVLEIAEEIPSVLIEFGREYLFDMRTHGEHVEIEKIYNKLPYEKQINPEYYMALYDVEQIHKDVNNLSEVPQVFFRNNYDDDFIFSRHYTRRYSSNAEFIYGRLNSEARATHALSVLYEDPDLVTLEDLKRAIEIQPLGLAFKQLTGAFLKSPRTYFRFMDDIDIFTLEDYLNAWSTKCKEDGNDLDKCRLFIPLKNLSYVKDYMIEAGAILHKKNQPIDFSPHKVFISPESVTWTRKGKKYIQPRETHSINNDVCYYIGQYFYVDNFDNLNYEEFRHDCFVECSEKIIRSFKSTAKNYGFTLTKHSINKIESLIPDFAIQDYLFKKELIDYKFSVDVLEVTYSNIKGFDKAKEYLKHSNKLLPKNDIKKEKKIKI